MAAFSLGTVRKEVIARLWASREKEKLTSALASALHRMCFHQFAIWIAVCHECGGGMGAPQAKELAHTVKTTDEFLAALQAGRKHRPHLPEWKRLACQVSDEAFFAALQTPVK